jgi:hypothetical protein
MSERIFITDETLTRLVHGGGIAVFCVVVILHYARAWRLQKKYGKKPEDAKASQQFAPRIPRKNRK